MLTIKRIMKNKRKEKRSCRLILACCALLLFISVNAFAQQQVTVTGNVKDEKGEPIIGANVIVKGTGTGSVTNVEGDFSLANVQNGATLEISFIGYLNQDVKVNGTKPVSIILKEDTKMLDEVVAQVGYDRCSCFRKYQNTGESPADQHHPIFARCCTGPEYLSDRNQCGRLFHQDPHPRRELHHGRQQTTGYSGRYPL